MRIVEHFELIVVRVSIELSSHCALIARDDLVKVARPDLQAVGVSWRNMAYDVHLLVGELGTLKLVDEPRRIY